MFLCTWRNLEPDRNMFIIDSTCYTRASIPYEILCDGKQTPRLSLIGNSLGVRLFIAKLDE